MCVYSSSLCRRLPPRVASLSAEILRLSVVINDRTDLKLDSNRKINYVGISSEI